MVSSLDTQIPTSIATNDNYYATIQAGTRGRVEWLDYARGIGITLVVLGHVILGLRADIAG